MTSPKLSGYTIAATDLDALTDWYVEQFALRVVAEFELEPYRLRGRALGAESGWTVELLAREGAVPGTRVDHPLDAALHAGYATVQVDVDALHESIDRLVAAGAQLLMPPHPGPGGMSAFVADPEGNVIRLREPGDVLGDLGGPGGAGGPGGPPRPAGE